jgi:hypothetical protein
MTKGTGWLLSAPFFVAVVLVAAAVLHPLTGVGPNNSTFAVLALTTIAAGLAIGVTTLFFSRAVGVGWRVLIGILYVPTVVFSLLLAGF